MSMMGVSLLVWLIVCCMTMVVESGLHRPHVQGAEFKLIQAIPAEFPESYVIFHSIVYSFAYPLPITEKVHGAWTFPFIIDSNYLRT